MTAQMTSQGILEKYEQMYNQARAANEQRYQEGMGILDQAISRYQPGGGFGQGAMAQYEQGKQQGLASGMQNLVGSGLSNTTIAGTLPLAYEQEVGTPFRLQLEDMRMQNLTQAERAKTGFIEGRQDTYPDFGMFAQLAMQSAMSGGGGGVSYGGSPFPSDQPGYSGIMNDYGRSGGSASSGGSGTGMWDLVGGSGSGGSTVKGQTATSGNMNPYYTPGVTGTGPSSGLSGGSMSESDYQTLLQQNMQANNLSQQGPFQYEPEGMPQSSDEASSPVVMYGTTVFGQKVNSSPGPITAEQVAAAKKKAGR